MFQSDERVLSNAIQFSSRVVFKKSTIQTEQLERKAR